MSIEKALDFNNGYGNYSGDVKPTTQADMYRFMGNQNNVLMALADAVLWQPSTAYKEGDVVHAPSMNGYHARCTVAGTSGSDVPAWNLGGVTQDGSVTWTLENQADYTHQLQRSTAYSVGDIAYSASLPSYLYLECTTAGTTGTSEPDMTTIVAGGVTVNDGTAVFTVKTVCAKEYVDALAETTTDTAKTYASGLMEPVYKKLGNDGTNAIKIGHLVIVNFDMNATLATANSWGVTVAKLDVPWAAKYDARSTCDPQEDVQFTVRIAAGASTITLHKYSGSNSRYTGWARGQIVYITDD